MIKVTVRHRDKDKAVYAAKILADDFRKIPNIMVLGPEFPPIARIQLLYAQDILLKIPRTLNITKVKTVVRAYMQTIVGQEDYKTTSFSINVDPY